MVKLSTVLPKEIERNGLEPNTRHLLDIYNSQEYVPIVALVRTKEVLWNEEHVRVPKIEVVHVEAVPDDQADDVRQLLVDLHDARLMHVAQPLDLPDPDDEADEPEPLAIEAGDDVVDAEVVEDDEEVVR